MARQVAITLDHLRRYAIARSLFKPTTLPQALRKLGFVQADPLRAPARAQDLTLRHRVTGYCAGDLERRYPRLGIEEDFFVNYGFLTRDIQALMHPRIPREPFSGQRQKQADAVLEFVRGLGEAHPREVDRHFAHGKTRNWFGGSSNASTELLDAMHYRGMLRIARRDAGTRVYAEAAQFQPATDAAAALDALIDVVVEKYAPLPARSLNELVFKLRGGAPQWESIRRAALQKAKLRLPSASIDGTTWYWPVGENPASARHRCDAAVRLLAPFDPVVWDRRRFELFWGWAYRFEAYTPLAKRVRGHYALPLLWHEQVIGWANVAVCKGQLDVDTGFVEGRAPRDQGFKTALAEELGRMQRFLKLPAVDG